MEPILSVLWLVLSKLFSNKTQGLLSTSDWLREITSFLVRGRGANETEFGLFPLLGFFPLLFWQSDWLREWKEPNF